ncbi:restriction endonuclease subunit S [Aquimarina sp. AD1]|uniref:restriction endonuclease subunit S n=1 Tax=Aquimarina sp. (strain AD1) TaxID=1714848 RepID=UPI000E4ECD68|nr:restriction endonuclease subunit S [Aquimarina sp. AD1]AXT55390.1 restriction endonuclease subunit S [Aquimarina sp. AD1]RKN28716.1 restriction endonuclease subunit S [Aquimarina sp. AD1]
MKDWKKVKLGTLLTESKVVSEKPNTDKRLRVKLNVLGIEKRPITRDKKGATKYYTRKAGQFVYGKQNLHKGAFGIVPEELDGFESSLDIPAFDIDESCYPEWIFYFFKKGDFYLKLETLAKGVGSKRIHPKKIYDLDIFLPSKEEQKKVLEEIEKAEANNQELVNEILSQEENLTKLRQSILQDAVQGKLTKEWREKNPKAEPASELLKKVKAEKEQLIKEKKIRRDNSKDTIIKDNCNWTLSGFWSTAKLYDVFSFIDYRGKTPQKSHKGKRLITAKNIRFGYIQNNPIEYVDDEFYKKWMTRGFPKKGDILFVTEGHTMGFAAIIDLNFDFALAQRTICFQPYLDSINTSFFFYLILSNQFQKIVFDNQTGSAAKGLKSSKLKKFPIPIPPLEEQNAIVEKVNQLLANCDKLEQEIKASKTNAEKLMQSVLSELLGEENNVLVNKTTAKKEIKKPSREIKYNSKTLLMDLVKLLKENGKLHAEDLWKMSKFPNNIDAFYAELKKQIEEEKAIKEVVNEKGYLELV